MGAFWCCALQSRIRGRPALPGSSSGTGRDPLLDPCQQESGRFVLDHRRRYELVTAHLLRHTGIGSADVGVFVLDGHQTLLQVCTGLRPVHVHQVQEIASQDALGAGLADVLGQVLRAVVQSRFGDDRGLQRTVQKRRERALGNIAWAFCLVTPSRGTPPSSAHRRI